MSINIVILVAFVAGGLVLARPEDQNSAIGYSTTVSDGDNPSVTKQIEQEFSDFGTSTTVQSGDVGGGSVNKNIPTTPNSTSKPQNGQGDSINRTNESGTKTTPGALEHNHGNLKPAQQHNTPTTTIKSTTDAEKHGTVQKVSSSGGATTQKTMPETCPPGSSNCQNREKNTDNNPVKQSGIASTSATTTESVQEAVAPDEDDDKDICFPVVGCFAMGKPWKSALRPIRKPFAPDKIQTSIFFFSRENPKKQTNIILHPEIKMNGAKFNPRKLTAIVVHGFASSGNATWMMDMKDAYLKQVDANVMLVDWGKGSNLFNYLQVAGNTRVVGKQLGMFVNHLKKNYGADPGKIHLIGHSLGAQVCSYLAKDVPGIARLTALDPAQPGFEGFEKLVRLDKTDAEFVDVVHTSAKPLIPTLGFGMIAPYGHVDFYMNGGFDQPGCLPLPKEELPPITNILDLAKFPVEALSKVITCPHSRAYDFIIEAFNETEKCVFWGHRADVENVLKSVTNTLTQGILKKELSLSSTCNKENCIPLGFATKKSPLRGSFVVTTAGRRPFCISEPGIPTESEPKLPLKPMKESIIQKIPKKIQVG